MVLRIVTSSKLKPLIFLSLSGLLISCAQQPYTPSVPATTVKDEAAATADADTLSGRQLYQLAANYQAEPQHYHLLKAARQALLDQDYLLALAISENLKRSPYPQIRSQNMLILLQAYIATAQQSNLTALLDNTALSDVFKQDRNEFLWQSAQYFSQQQRQFAASKNLLQLAQDPRSAKQYADYPSLLWQNLTALSDNQLAELRVGASQLSLSWLDLATLSRQYIGQPQLLQQAFADWQRRNPWMPPVADMPDSVQKMLLLQPYQPRKIAVLLPLQGQFRQHAQAIQYGILAAASNSEQTNIAFIDSQQSAEQLQQQLHNMQADFVIGPLLKDQVDTIAKRDDWQWPTLFLNSQDPAAAVRKNQFFFALSMEDEASQTAQLFQQKNFKHPVIISASNNISLRLQQHFVSEWQQLGHPAPQQYQFNNKEELESLISKLLETDRSKERVKKIDALVSEKLESDTHSRLDIDAIYLIADPMQTRLFKPFVDVSVSETAPRLPIYASSRSHSTGLDNTEQRDLNGLTFTEMPWMLPLQTSASLRKEYQLLFQDQDETLQRLFAMGFDAYQLIGSLRQQQQLPSAVFPGLTGQLRLTANGSIVRQLSWASYRNNRLAAVQEP